MWVERRDLSGILDSMFTDENGRLCFRLRGIETMLPVAEAEMQAVRESYRRRSRWAMAASWPIVAGAVAWWYVHYLDGGSAFGLWGVPGAAFAVVFLLHAWAFGSSTWSLRRRLLALAGSRPKPPGEGRNGRWNEPLPGLGQ
jgi:hypothetical protein